MSYIKIDEYELEEMYKQSLDEDRELIRVGGSTFDPSRVLKQCDPVAYRTGMHDYADSLLEDGYEIEGY
jgi:hypothetical protein